MAVGSGLNGRLGKDDVFGFICFEEMIGWRGAIGWHGLTGERCFFTGGAETLEWQG